jgi:murein DD-endopeptidase MepM/ murein hydrolase activator NlpD
VNGRITSLFGPRRHPILGYARMHAGVDFGAGWGTPIVAAASGVVGYAGYHGGHGNYVRLDHGGGLGTGYGHMSRFAVSPGQSVSAGQVIGYVGSTGLSTGPHLHYEMYRNGRTVNPLDSQFASVSVVTRQVDPAKMGAFRARLAEIKALPTGTTLAARPRVARIAMR